MAELWVFGYGSLMWRPDFPYLESRPATLLGAHRALCVYSWVHRGTRDHPGLVLGLDRGGACRGVAFRVAEADAAEVVRYLRAREQVTEVYRERMRPVRFDRGAPATALAYLVDRAHPQYAGKLDVAAQLAMVAEAHGRSGPNRDYVLSTVAHLEELGIRNAGLEWLAARLKEREPEGTGAARPALAQPIRAEAPPRGRSP
jgi:glutathione-specific gamma-glutamylcyclotransferase